MVEIPRVPGYATLIDAHPHTGLPAGRNDDVRAALLALAEQCRTGVSGLGGSS